MIKIFYLLVIFNLSTNAQNISLIEGTSMNIDKCGFTEFSDIENESVDSWGYSYDSLLVDLNKWKLNPYIKIDSIGLSVQNRPLWQLTITQNPNNIQGKRTVYIHARTHPQETESFWVTREIIKILTSETDLGLTARANCVFYIVPMFNPDGVQLNRPRNNANNVDLERNWFTFPHQPEVAALKSRFLQLMNSPHPIEVELNMHSSSLCRRYFVYHDSAGTSPQFAIMQQNYIQGIRNYFPTGIQPWNYFISWTTGTPLKYPECWFWVNYGESVMALTYEDMYQCAGTGKFDSTANALVRGVLDYMNIPVSSDYKEITVSGFELYQNYPNPFFAGGSLSFSGNSVTTIKFSIPSHRLSSEVAKSKLEEEIVTLKVYDILGNEVATLINEPKSPGTYEIKFDALSNVKRKLSSGVYLYQLKTGGLTISKKMILIK